MRTKKHLLVIRLSAMGDIAMTVHVIAALVQQYPELKITVLTRAFFKPLFSQFSNVSIFEVDVKGRHNGFLGIYRIFKELNTLKIDAIADLHNVLRSKILKIFFIPIGIPFVQIYKGRAEKAALTRAKAKIFKALKPTHQRYADVFKTLGYPLNLTTDLILPKRELSINTAKLRDKLAAKKIVGVAPFAAFDGKMYPIDLMEKVLKYLTESGKFHILLFGGGNKEQLVLEQLQNKFINTTSVVNKYTFSEELALISNLDLMLAMDSGNAHLAALFGVPTVTLWGITHPYAGFYPFGQPIENALLADREQFPLVPTSVYGNKMPNGYGKAMRTIRPQDVVAKIKAILKVS